MNKSNYFLLFLAFYAWSFNQLNAQQFFFSKEKPSFCNATDGILTIVPTRGVPPFTYSWSNGSTDVSAKNLAKGSYSATLTDATGASVTHSIILNTDEFDLFLSDSRPGGGCNPNSGALTVDPIGGAAPFIYTWSNGMTDAAIQGLPSGPYSLTVQDANGCTAEGIYEVAPFFGYLNPLAAISILDKPNCTNPNNGQLIAGWVYGNQGPFVYSWSNGATDQTVSNLPEGNYSVTITDGVGCSSVALSGLNKQLTTTGSAICSGNNTGTASASLENATAPVTYAWSNGQFGPTLTGLTEGFYSVTATDALGCSASAFAQVVTSQLYVTDYSQHCFTGNNGYAYCNVGGGDQAVSILWDNGGTESWNYTLGAGDHTVTVTTSLGCTLTGSVHIATPIAPGYTFSATPTSADCAAGLGGAMNLSISGGIQPFSFYAYGPDGYYSSDINALQNLKAGKYYVSVYNQTFGCHAGADINIQDAGGFEPELVTEQIDCLTGYGSAAIVNAGPGNVQYEWSTGNTGPALFNLTQGCYEVQVNGSGSCQQHYKFCLYSEDSLQSGLCLGLASGRLINDQGIAGCTGTQGLPFQVIRTQPSGALNFTDQNGIFNIQLPAGSFDLDAPQYDPADIACPANAKYTVNSVVGNTISNLDFHFFNNNPQDLRVTQQSLRTAQPGYPYSIRVEVCNDGATATPGTMDFEYGNFLGTLNGHYFPQHPGAFTLTNEAPGAPNNTGDFAFPSIAPGACEQLQLDLSTAINTIGNTSFVNTAKVSPNSGDPTPNNNISAMYNTVVGSFDPNSVLSFPARNGNPKDGGDLLLNEDHTLVYQIFFQNTGTAAADQVIVRNPVDDQLNLTSIRNIKASHNMKITTENDNHELVFKFEHISLPDSTTDYAGSIGSIQYEIDLKPGVSLGAEINNQASIFFDFNSAIVTNKNVLKVVDSSKTVQLQEDKNLQLFPNPTDAFVGFYCDGPSKLDMFNTLGELVSTQAFATGLQQVSTIDLPNGIYLLMLDTNGKKRSGKLVVSH